MEYHIKNLSDMTLGERVSFFRNQNGMTQEALAKAISVSQKTVTSWERDTRDIPLNYLGVLCKTLNVTSSMLLRGVKEENETVYNTLGLTDETISYLKDLKSRESDYQESFVEISNTLSDNPDRLSVPEDKPITEGGTTDEQLFIINWLLSHDRGRYLFSMIAKYCLTSMSQCWVCNPNENYDPEEPSDSMEECNEIYYKKRIGEGWVLFNPAVLRYALIPSITDEINQIRNEIIEGR